MTILRHKKWFAVKNSRARYRHGCIHRDGVGVLVLQLEGSLSRNADEVDRVRQAIDEIGAAMPGHVEVSVLDVTRFANADGDEAGILTSALKGLPCCWVTREQQGPAGDERWDLPEAERLVPTVDGAVARVVALRRAGHFEVKRHGTLGTWNERGLILREKVARADTVSVWYRNRLVERVSSRPEGVTKVLWPFPDRMGTENEAVKKRARLRYVDDRLVEIDLSPRQTGRTDFAGWLRVLEGASLLEELSLIDVSTGDDEILSAVAATPSLRVLRLEGTGVTDHTINAIAQGAGPSLERIFAHGTAVSPAARAGIAKRRPGVSVI